MARRVLDFIFFLYFASHIPISIFMDFQSVLPSHWYPQTLADLKTWYCGTFRDPMMMTPAPWFKSLLISELLLQFPFLPFAAYGFFKGAESCKWLRLPVIIYGAHVATTLIAIVSHIMFHDFSTEEFQGPETFDDRIFLMSIYAPYFIIPVLLIFDGSFSSVYLEKFKRGQNTSHSLKKKS